MGSTDLADLLIIESFDLVKGIYGCEDSGNGGSVAFGSFGDRLTSANDYSTFLFEYSIFLNHVATR